MIGRRGVLVGLLAAGCAGGAVRAEVEAAADAELRRRPERYANGEARAWTVARDGRPRGLLWGTMHIPYDDATLMPRQIREKFYASASLTVESGSRASVAYVRDQVAAWRKVDPAALAALGADTRAALRAAGVEAKEEAVLSLVGLSDLVKERAPGVPASTLPTMGGSVDYALTVFAQGLRIPVRSLENLQAVPEPTAKEPNGAAAADLLRLTLRRADDIQAFSSVMREWYGRGEVGRLLAGLMAWRAGPADLVHSDAWRAAVLDARNRAWMDPLERTLNEPGTHFAAFGCGHLPGADGVVALLRKRGWDMAACVGDRCA